MTAATAAKQVTQLALMAPATTPTVYAIAQNVANQTVRPATTGRKDMLFVSNANGKIYVKLGATATSTSRTFTLPSIGARVWLSQVTGVGLGWDGRVDCIFELAGAGTMQVTEML